MLINKYMHQLVMYPIVPFSFFPDIDIDIIEAYRIIYIPRAVESHSHDRRCSRRPRCRCRLLAKAVAALFGRIKAGEININPTTIAPWGRQLGLLPVRAM